MEQARILKENLYGIVEGVMKIMVSEGALDLFRKNQSTGKPWNGVEGTELMSGGAFFNPTIMYNGKEYDLHEVEEFLYPYYEKVCMKYGTEPTQDGFYSMNPAWFKRGLDVFVQKNG